MQSVLSHGICRFQIYVICIHVFNDSEIQPFSLKMVNSKQTLNHLEWKVSKFIFFNSPYAQDINQANIWTIFLLNFNR